jgi:hypothetical protein
MKDPLKDQHDDNVVEDGQTSSSLQMHKRADGSPASQYALGMRMTKTPNLGEEPIQINITRADSIHLIN